MGTPGPSKIGEYSREFRATAVRLSQLPDLVRDVAAALDIHPFMLSRWRCMAREGTLVTKRVKLDVDPVAELQRLR
jgi:transposase